MTGPGRSAPGAIHRQGPSDRPPGPTDRQPKPSPPDSTGGNPIRLATHHPQRRPRRIPAPHTAHNGPAVASSMIGAKMGAATESSTSETPNEFTSVTDWFVFPSKQVDTLPLRCVLRARSYARLSWRTVGHSRPQRRSGEASGPPQIAPFRTRPVLNSPLIPLGPAIRQADWRVVLAPRVRGS